MRIKNLLRPLLAVAFLLPLAADRAVAAPPVEEIVARANLAAYYAGDDGRAEVNMTITDSQGRARERRFVILRRDLEDGGRQMFYVYFERPTDVRRMVFMVHKQVAGDDDRWLYLPDLDLVKRIAASDKRTSFVGSHYFYEDVSGRGPAEDHHQLVEETAEHYVLNNIPKEPGAVEFASYRIWIDKKNFLPVKAEYLDKGGNPYRLVEALAIEDVQGLPTVTRSRVKDLAGGGETVMEFGNISYNLGLDESLFSERYLRRPPKEIRR